MTHNGHIFLTGATGSLGSFLVKELLDKGYRLSVLVRGRQRLSAADRFRAAVEFVYRDEWDLDFISDRVTVVEGEITQPGLGIPPTEMERLVAETDIMIHSAALAELNFPLEFIRMVNVEGTRNVMEMASQCHQFGRLRHIHHISTMYIAGDHRGDFDETMLDVGQGFHNTYEQTKFEAEHLVRDYQSRGLPVKILRPSMVMGDSCTGRINSFRLFYHPLHYFARELFKVFPCDLDCRQNLINIDVAVRAISTLLTDDSGNDVYHIMTPEGIRLREFLNMAARYFEFRLPRCVSSDKFDFSRLTPVQKGLCAEHVPYFNYRACFQAGKTEKLLESHYDFHYPVVNEEILRAVFRYCVETGFLKRRGGRV